MTIAELNQMLKDELSSIFPDTEAWSVSSLILEHFGYSNLQVLKEPDLKVDHKIRDEIIKIVFELHQNKPIQYVLGMAWFMDMKFRVNENVLIPRPETEEIVLAIINDNKIKNPSILDIGTGSGCIAVSLAKNIPGARVMGMDIDSKALHVAKQNAIENKTNVEYICHSVFDIRNFNYPVQFDIIVSNPPYIAKSEMKHMALNVLDYEPQIALFVEDTEPLIFYRKIIDISKKVLKKSGVIWVEINANYGNECLELFKAAGFDNSRLFSDIHGRNRYIKAEKHNG